MNKMEKFEERQFNPGQKIYGPNGESIEVMLVTPEIAKNFLMKNTNNRKMKVYSKNKYSRDMENENWQFNGDAIRLDSEGNLRDGQNRCQAIVDSGVSIYAIVIKGIKKEAVQTIDTGNSRTNADVLEMHGFKYSNELSAAAKRVILLDKGMPIGNTKTFTLSINEVLEEIMREDRAELYKQSTLFAMNVYKDYRALSKSLISVVYVKVRSLGHSEEKVKEFFDQLSDKKEACSVIRSLRKALKDSTAPGEKLQLVARAWNEFSIGNFKSTIVKSFKKELESFK